MGILSTGSGQPGGEVVVVAVFGGFGYGCFNILLAEAAVDPELRNFSS